MQTFILLVGITLALIVMFGCKDDSKDETPQVVGCTEVKYQGYTYTISGCRNGVISFDVTTSQGGHTASFHITCSGGCVKGATKGNSSYLNYSITGPDQHK
jgi:hypothetical protein